MCTQWIIGFQRAKGLVSNPPSRLYTVYTNEEGEVRPEDLLGFFFLQSLCRLLMEQRPSDSPVTAPSITLHSAVMICQSDSGTGTVTVSQLKHNPLSYANSRKNRDDTLLKKSPLGLPSHRFAHLWKIYPALWNLFVLFMLFQFSGAQDSSGFKEDQMREKLEDALLYGEAGLPGDYLESMKWEGASWLSWEWWQRGDRSS